MGPQHHAESQKKRKSQSQENFQTGWTNLIIDPSGNSRASNKRIIQLRAIDVDNKNKTQYNSAYRTSLT